MSTTTDSPDYGRPDGEAPDLGQTSAGARPALEPVLLPRPAVQVGQFGGGAIKGGKILHLTRKNEKAVLEACSVSANLSQACKKAGVSYRRVHTVIASNPAFRARVQEHLDFAIDRLEQCSLRRAIVGVKEPVYYKGELIDHVYRPSDKLAVKILEARRPEVYGRKGGEAGSTHVVNIALLPRAELAQRAAQVIDAPITPLLPDKSST